MLPLIGNDAAVQLFAEIGVDQNVLIGAQRLSKNLLAVRDEEETQIPSVLLS